MSLQSLFVPLCTLIALTLAPGCWFSWEKDGKPDDTGADPCAPITWYQDWDGDGFGSEAFWYSGPACEPPHGYVATAGDCDDGDADINPGAEEACDGLDNDCSGEADDDLPDWYTDSDGDGYGAGVATESCEQPDGMVGQSGDHDDEDATVYPGAPELCDGLDNDQDGLVDEDGVDMAWYPDADGDGYGDMDVDGTTGCEAPEDGWVTDGSDCDDEDADVNPAALEYCDHEDDNCDGNIDEAETVDGDPAWLDRDGDGYGDPASEVLACQWDTSVVWNDDDCDDGASAVYPGAEEICDGELNDCDEWGVVGAAQDIDGSVSFESALGDWEDWTATFAAGTADAPVAVDVTESGTLRFCAGTYYTTITTSAARVNLEGLYGAEDTVLSTNFGGPVLTTSGLVASPMLSLSGLTVYESGGDTAAVSVEEGTVTIDNSVFEGNSSATESGAVYVREGMLSIDVSAFSGNWSTSTDDAGEGVGGGAIGVSEGWLTVEESDFEANSSALAGGAVYGGVTNMVARGCDFVGNQAPSGGGIYSHFTSVASPMMWVSDSSFVENDALMGQGGAIKVFNYGVDVEGTVFQGNTADGAGGAISAGAAIFTLDNVYFYQNTASEGGGALNIGSASWGFYGSIADALFEGNLATNGAALYASTAIDLEISNSGFTENEATNYGGVAFLGAGGDIALTDSSVVGNEAWKGIFVPVYAGLECADSVISDNSDRYGAVYLYNADASLSSTSCTWGNTPHDVYIEPLDTAYDASDPFSCDGTSGCL